MKELLTELDFSGLLIGLATFVIIGIFHPIVIKAEYYWGTRCWWVFVLVGVIALGTSLWVSQLLFSTLLGVIAFSCFWSVKELFDQEKRVAKGWFPANPNKKTKK